MKQEILNEYAGKTIKLILKSGHRYQGKIIKVENEIIRLDDRYLGVIVLECDAVRIVEPAGKGGQQ